MSNFFVALYAVLPMFIMLAIGFTVRKMKVIEEAHLPVLNKIVFNVFFPFLMFNNRNITRNKENKEKANG